MSQIDNQIMADGLLAKAKALESSEEAQEVEAQSLRPSFVDRAKSTLIVSVLVTGAVATVLWNALIFGGLFWLLFGS